MAYENIYQRRRTATPDQAAATPQPNGVSMVDHFRNLGKLPIDARAGGGFTEAEREQARQIRFAMTEGRWTFGNVVPHRLAPLVWDGAPPQGMAHVIHGHMTIDAGADVRNRLARKITTDFQASLATDHAPARRLATDQDPHRPTMSYKLSQVMGDYQLLDEDSFDESMQHWGVTEPRDRIGLKAEATALGMMRPRGQAPKLPARYIQAPHVNDPKNQHFIDKNSPSATKDTGGRPDTPGKRWGLTMQASSDGFAPANTSIWFDDAGLANL